MNEANKVNDNNNNYNNNKNINNNKVVKIIMLTQHSKISLIIKTKLIREGESG